MDLEAAELQLRPQLIAENHQLDFDPLTFKNLTRVAGLDLAFDVETGAGVACVAVLAFPDLRVRFIWARFLILNRKF